MGRTLTTKWLVFSFLSSTGKTSVWEVLTQDRKQILGAVKWFGRWRKYAYFPENGTVYEQDCLRDIAKFCQDLTTHHRQERNSVRTPVSK